MEKKTKKKQQLCFYISPHQVVGRAQTAQGVCSLAVFPGLNDPALHGC